MYQYFYQPRLTWGLKQVVHVAFLHVLIPKTNQHQATLTFCTLWWHFWVLRFGIVWAVGISVYLLWQGRNELTVPNSSVIQSCQKGSSWQSPVHSVLGGWPNFGQDSSTSPDWEQPMVLCSLDCCPAVRLDSVLVYGESVYSAQNAMFSAVIAPILGRIRVAALLHIWVNCWGVVVCAVNSAMPWGWTYSPHPPIISFILASEGSPRPIFARLYTPDRWVVTFVCGLDLAFFSFLVWQ